MPFSHQNHTKKLGINKMTVENVAQKLSIAKTPVAVCIGNIQKLNTLSNTLTTKDNVIKNLLANVPQKKWIELEWTEYFISKMAVYVGATLCKLNQLNIYLKTTGDTPTYLIKIPDSLPTEAVKSLIDDIPNKLKELSQLKMGYIVLITPENATRAITQNFGQFKNLYRDYLLDNPF